jgi:hypothetical protein
MAAAPASMLEQELEIEESEEPVEPVPRAGRQRRMPVPAPLRGTTLEGNGGGSSRAPLGARTGSSKSAVTAASSVGVSIEESTEAAAHSPEGASTIAAPRLAPGQEQDIQVPIEIEVEGRVKRLTLSIRLRLSESKRLP